MSEIGEVRKEQSEEHQLRDKIALETETAEPRREADFEQHQRNRRPSQGNDRILQNHPRDGEQKGRAGDLDGTRQVYERLAAALKGLRKELESLRAEEAA